MKTATMTADQYRAMLASPKQGRYSVAPREMRTTPEGYVFDSKRQMHAAIEFRHWVDEVWPTAHIAYDVRWPCLLPSDEPGEVLYVEIDYAAWTGLDDGIRIVRAVDVKPKGWRGRRKTEERRGYELFRRAWGCRVETWER